jgi:hypothetical protein
VVPLKHLKLENIFREYWQARLRIFLSQSDTKIIEGTRI